jgi:hypothetical protein
MQLHFEMSVSSRHHCEVIYVLLFEEMKINILALVAVMFLDKPWFARQNLMGNWRLGGSQLLTLTKA